MSNRRDSKCEGRLGFRYRLVLSPAACGGGSSGALAEEPTGSFPNLISSILRMTEVIVTVPESPAGVVGVISYPTAVSLKVT